MPQQQNASFWKQFKAKACSANLKAATKEAVLQEVVVNLVQGGSLAARWTDAALEALLERERVASTGVGMSVAIPHVKLDGIERAAVCLSVHRAGVPWSAVDGEPVHLLFTVLRPGGPSSVHDPERHLAMMRWIARLSRDGDFRRFARDASTRTELVALLREKSEV